MKLTCDIVQDLLPLYEDNMCSKESQEAIDEHLRECESCRNQLNMIHELELQETPLESSRENNVVAKGLKKIRRRWMASLLAVILLIPTCIMGWSQYKGTGIHFTNLNDLYIVNKFVKQLENNDYEKAFQYIDIEGKKEEWLKQQLFEEKDLIELESDARTKFCDLASEVNEVGGIKESRYLGITEIGEGEYRVYYSVVIAEEKHELIVDVTNDGINNFGCDGSFLTDSLAKLGAWSEYLWQDYEGCYFDPESGEYIYYDEIE